MSNALATTNGHSAAMVEQVALQGDLAKLTPADRVKYYTAVCESLGLNPLTKPFDFLTLNGKLVMYARKDCTDQLRKKHNVSVQIVARERIDDVYAVTARATLPDGRFDEAMGVVTIANLKGDNLANALMKAETKAKRRVTLSIVGLGMLDESETETIRTARAATVDMATGEILESAPQHAALPASTQTHVEHSDDADLVEDDDSIADAAGAGFNWRTVPFEFGKNKGKTMGEVPSEYLEWLQNNYDPKPRQDGTLWPDAELVKRGLAAWADEYEAEMQPYRENPMGWDK